MWVLCVHKIKRMIIVNLKGGIGNQMFQYALGKKLALKNNDTLKLAIDTLQKARSVGDMHRPYSLDAFSISAEIATASEVRTIKYPYGIISMWVRFINARILKKTNIGFIPEVLNWRGDLFLDGYWQSPSYFTDIRDTLLTEFTLETPVSDVMSSYKQQIESSTSVSIHIRRGDYVENPRVRKEFGICEPAYYKAAIVHVTEKLTAPTFFIFSDDIQWVKENLSLPESTVFVQDSDLKAVEELTLMAMCKHNIIANSTFSWWGAWLNANKNKIVVCPTPWFENNSSDLNLIPKIWIQLPKA